MSIDEHTHDYDVLEQSQPEVEEQILRYVGHYQDGGGVAPIGALLSDLDAGHLAGLTSITKLLINGELYAPGPGKLKIAITDRDNGGDEA